MIYICHIIYWDYVVIYVLTVGDDELAVGDDDDALSEVAEGEARVGVLGNSHGWATCNPASQVRSTGTSEDRRNENII
jgi:hypothetical protein